MFITTARPVEIRKISGSSQDWAMATRIIRMRAAAIIITDAGGVLPSWLVSTTMSSSKREEISCPSSF